MNTLELQDWNGSLSRWRLFAGVLVISTLATGGVLHQQQVDREWEALPVETPGDVDSMQARLDAVEVFLDANPLWIRAHRAVRERTRLSTELQVLRTQRVLEDMRAEQARDLELAEAVGARQRGADLLAAGDPAGALQELETALHRAPAGWSERERVERDIQAIRDLLEEAE